MGRSFFRSRAADSDVVEVLKRVEKALGALRKQAEKEVKPDRRPALDDPQFLAVFSEIRGHRRTKLTRDRLLTLWQAASNARAVPGAAAEIGSYQGGSAYFIAASFRALLGHEVLMEVIDTFEGHPQEKLSEHDSSVHRDAPVFTDTTYESVREYLSPFERLTVHKAEFSSVAPSLPDSSYRLVHIDVDLYEPARECLAYFAPRLSPGGVIVLDDHGNLSCPGIVRAGAEFRASRDDFQAWEYGKQLVLVKNLGVPAASSEQAA